MRLVVKSEVHNQMREYLHTQGNWEERRNSTIFFSYVKTKKKVKCFDTSRYVLTWWCINYIDKKKLWSEKEEKWQTIFSICLFKFCICSTIRRTSDSTIFSGSLFISAVLCWACKSKVYHHFDHLYQIKKSNHDQPLLEVLSYCWTVKHQKSVYTIRQNSNARKIWVHQSLY